MKGCLLVLLGLFVLFVVMLYLGQGRLIYLPRRYSSDWEELSRVDRVSYLLEGETQSLYLPKRTSPEPPEKVWWLFGGNGSVALGWVDIVELVPPEANVAFILFDYPGYGLNGGRPNPERIAKSVDLAVPEVARHLGMSEGELLSRSRTLGHSLGAAVAFDFANRHELNRIIAISPFTTMEAMAKKQMGPVVALLLSHRYDNEQSLDGILASDRPVEITIFHGESDNLIPASMGRSLAERDSGGKRVKFFPVPGAGHNNILSIILPDLLRELEE